MPDAVRGEGGVLPRIFGRIDAAGCWGKQEAVAQQFSPKLVPKSARPQEKTPHVASACELTRKADKTLARHWHPSAQRNTWTQTPQQEQQLFTFGFFLESSPVEIMTPLVGA